MVVMMRLRQEGLHSSARRRAFFPPSSSLAPPTVGVSRFHRPLRSNMSASAEAAPDPAGDPASPLPGVGEGNPPGGDVVVQYVVLRRDLIDTWPLGSVVAQGFRHHPDVLAYCSDRNLDSMHKVRSTKCLNEPLTNADNCLPSDACFLR
ncbi:unnamed protein product [Musa hybrid cultivar]